MDAVSRPAPLGGGPPLRRPLWTVQVLRGTAALMVIVGHGQSAVATILHGSGHAFVRSTVVPWGAGVDLFFVISGFIIVHASGRLFGIPGATAEFLKRRLVRIVPLYWLVSTVFVLLLAAANLKGGDRFPPPAALAASYAFVPFDTWGDGRMFPVFDLGWTLNYEMLFYALLAVVVALPRRRALSLLGCGIAVLTLGGTALHGPSALWFWTRPIILDFGLGLAVGALLGAGVRLPGAVRVALAGGGLAVLLLDPGHLFDGPAGVTVSNDLPRVLLAGVPVAALLAAAVLGREPRMPRVAAPLTHIGDASYSLYLLHPFALIVLEKLAQKLGVVRDVPGWALVLAVVVTAIGLALAGYRWVERPMTEALGGLLRARKPVAHAHPDRRPSC